MPSTAIQLSGLRKSAMVLLSLDSAAAGELLRCFPEDLADDLRAEMQRLGNSGHTASVARQSTLREFLRSAQTVSALPVHRAITATGSPGSSSQSIPEKSIQAGDRAMATILDSTVAAIEDRVNPDKTGAGGTEPSHPAPDVMSRLERMSDRDLLAIIEQLDTDSLVLALRGAGRAIRTKVLSNMLPAQASRIAARLAGTWPATLREIESAQQRVAEVVFRLEAAGEIEPASAGAKEDSSCP